MSTCWKPKKLGPDAVLEDEHEQAVGGSDREQVERDRDGGDDDRAEGDREQDEAEAEDEGEHDREPVADDVEVVDALGGRSADEDRRLETAERLRDQVGTKVADRAGRFGAVGVAGDRNRDQHDVAAVEDGLVGGAECVLVGDARRQFGDRRLHRAEPTSP